MNMWSRRMHQHRLHNRLTWQCNSRPGWLGAVVKRAIENKAEGAKTRDQFLDILRSSMMDVYGEKEPLREFKERNKKAAKQGHTLDEAQQAALKAELLAPWTKIGRTKADHITTKIPRTLSPVHLDAMASPTAPAAKEPAPAIAVANVSPPDHHGDHEDEAHVAPPRPKVQPAPAEQVAKHHEEKPAPPPVVAHHEDKGAAPVASPSSPSTSPIASAHADPVKDVDAAPPHVDAKVTPRILHLDNFPPIHAFVPPGGVKGHVEVMLFLHGMYAYYDRVKTEKADPHKVINDPDPDKSMNLAGATAATTRNLITLAPVATSAGHSWPHWKDIADGEGFPKMISKALAKLTEELHVDPKLEVGSISLAGHSAGGQGIGFAAAQLEDAVHDVTMEDGGYHGPDANWEPAHRDLAKWLLGGKTDKILRVMFRRGHDDSEGHVLQSIMNEEKLRAFAASKEGGGHAIIVKRDSGNKDKRTVKDAQLDHVLHINGLPGTRTVNVYTVNTEDHMRMRNDVTQRLITEGRDTEFEEGAGAATGPLQGAGPLPVGETKRAGHVKHDEHHHARAASTRTRVHEEHEHKATTPATPTATPANVEKHDDEQQLRHPLKSDRTQRGKFPAAERCGRTIS